MTTTALPDRSTPNGTPESAAASPDVAAGSLSTPNYGIKAVIPEQGLVIIYTPGEPSLCPNCHAKNWNIGRITAECAACAFAVPLEQANR